MTIANDLTAKDCASAPTGLLPIEFANVRCEDESSPTIAILASASRGCLLSSGGEIYGGTQVASKRRNKRFNKYSGHYTGPRAASVPNVLLAIQLGRRSSLPCRRRNLFNQASYPMGVYREDGDLSFGSRDLPSPDTRSTLPPVISPRGNRISNEEFQPAALLLPASFRDNVHAISEEGGNEYQASGETCSDIDDSKRISIASRVPKETRGVARARRLRSIQVRKRGQNHSRRFKHLRRYTKLALTQSTREVPDEDATIEQVPKEATSLESPTISHEAACALSSCSGTDCISKESSFMAYPIALLGDVLERRFDRLGEISDLDRAISLRVRCVELTPDGHRNKPHRLCTLAFALWTRFERLGEMSDLQEVISAETRCVELSPNGHPDNPRWFSNLGISLQGRFDRLGEISDLEQAVSLSTRSVDLTPDGHPDKLRRLGSLGSALGARFDRLGEIADLEQAISLMTRCVDLTPDDHSYKSYWLGNLGIALETRFKRLGEIGDLEEAISLKTRSVDLTPDDHPDKPRQLGNLGIALERCFDRLGEISHLEEAISLKTRSVNLIPDGHLHKPPRLGNLGVALKKRFDRLGEIGDLEEAISLKTRSVDLTPDGHPDKPLRLGSLGNALETRFDRLGEIGDLEKAISLMTRCVDLTPDDHPDKPQWLGNLGNALETRFKRLGEIGDLEEAISLKTRCVDLTPDGHPDKSRQLGNLGIALEKRFDRLGEIGDLEEAISLKTRCVDLTPDGRPDKPQWLGNLGIALERRFDRLGEINDLEEAVSLMTRSVDLTPDGRPDKADRLDNLGNALETRFYHMREIGDLKRAIQAMRNSVHFADVTNPLRIHYYLQDLSRSLQEYFISTGNSGACPEAVECLETIINTKSSPALGSFIAACHLVALLQSSINDRVRDATTYGKLISVYEHAIVLIPQIIWLGSSITRRYELLKDISDMTSRAASTAIAVGNFTRAIEWMEQGRSVVWNQLQQLRSPLHELSELYPDFAKQLQTISSQLQNSSNVAGGFIREEDKSDRIIQQQEISARIQFAQEYERTLSTIRDLEGFKSFLKPKTYTDIVHVCDNGPVIVVNVSSISSDALVCLSAAQIIHVHLTDFDKPTAQELVDRFRSLLHGCNVRKSRQCHSYADETIDASGDPSQRALMIPSRESRNRSITTVLGGLWKRVVHPILSAIEDELFEYTVDCLPHVTWCVAGPLALLPIHAAGEYDAPNSRKIYDFVVSSYAPTLSSLLQPPPHAFNAYTSFPKILAISQSESSRHPPLPGTIEEMDKLRGRFPGAEMVHLSDPDATVGAVLNAMDEYQCSYIHIACHGTQASDDPRNSAFELHDGPLQLGRLMSKSIGNAKLAFLSACQTATGDAKLTDESVHLAAGMLAVGYRGVIGTMWSICDDDAPLVTDDFYRVLMEREAAEAEGSEAGGSRVHAAYALHEATKKLRETLCEKEVLRWAPFVHFGR